MKILITGVHGFVGSNLVKALSKEHVIFGLDIIAPQKDGVKTTFGWEHLDGKEIPNVDAIMCGNDDVATSVIKALAVAQLAGEIPVVGQDADLPACQHIVQGTQLMTVYKPVGKLAEEAAKLSVQLAQGQDLSVMTKISDGENTIPYVAIEPVAVNKDNLDEVIIDGGFHSREDVYLNVGE